MSADNDRGQTGGEDEVPATPPLVPLTSAARAPKRHWLQGSALALGVGVMATFVVSQMPPHYEAYARVSVPPKVVAHTTHGRT